METVLFPEIFYQIRKLLIPYGTKMQVRVNNPDNYQLVIVKDIELAGRKYPECYFSGVQIHKTMVSFYFFPYYTHADHFVIPEPLLKNLKGKNCFNFKKLNTVQEAAIAELLKKGFALYGKAFGLK
jgi:hypothetical protein